MPSVARRKESNNRNSVGISKNPSYSPNKPIAAALQCCCPHSKLVEKICELE